MEMQLFWYFKRQLSEKKRKPCCFSIGSLQTIGEFYTN